MSVLAEGDDFRVRALADGEPDAGSGLGPFAVVDIVQGATPSLAAERERLGYYALVVEAPGDAGRAGVRGTLRCARRPSPRLRCPSSSPPPKPASAKSKKAREPSVDEKIAPKKRAHVEAVPSPVEPFGVGGVRKLEPARPRGRFTQLEAPRASIAELEAGSQKDTLSSLLEQHRHRAGLLQAISSQYAGRNGQELSLAELDGVLRGHGLLEEQETREREMVLASYQDQRGASGRVAWALSLRPADLTRMVRSLGLERAIEDIREHFRREALAPHSWTARLDLLGRTKYLADLGITQKFTEQLKQELRAALREAGGSDTQAKQQKVAQRLGVSSELLTRTVEKLGLAPSSSSSSH